MGQKRITIREAELGPVIARADHKDEAIEVNKDIFYKLPPMAQEFVLCHEICHLRYREWDEARTNQLAAKLFMNRAEGDQDLEKRKEFLSYLDGNGGYSNFAWASLIPAAFSLGWTIYGIIKERNAGWYSWGDQTKVNNLNVMLTQSFEQSRRSSSRSASDYFWDQMANYTNKDNDLDQFLSRSGNSWVAKYIKKYEKKYGFGFTEITPIDITAYPLVMLAIGLLVGFLIYKIFKKVRK